MNEYKFIINRTFFFIYNKNNIFYYELHHEKTFHKCDLKKIPLEISPLSKYSVIKGVHLGADQYKVVIIIDSTIETDMVIEWDLKN